MSLPFLTFEFSSISFIATIAQVAAARHIYSTGNAAFLMRQSRNYYND